VLPWNVLAVDLIGENHVRRVDVALLEGDVVPVAARFHADPAVIRLDLRCLEHGRQWDAGPLDVVGEEPAADEQHDFRRGWELLQVVEGQGQRVVDGTPYGQAIRSNVDFLRRGAGFVQRGGVVDRDAHARCVGWR